MIFSECPEEAPGTSFLFWKRLDKSHNLCYYGFMILTLSICCVKGAHNRIRRGKPWLICRCRTGQRLIFLGGLDMETRVAVMSIIVENPEVVEKLNGLLHEYGEFIIGRMGIPYRKRGVNIIAIALDAPQNTISALSGKIGSLSGVSVKTAYSSVISTD